MEDNRQGYLIALIGACALMMIFAFYKLVECDAACEAAKTQVAQEVKRQQEAPPPPPRLPVNTSSSCPGNIVDVAETTAERDMNPNNCRVSFGVAEGRLTVRWWVYPWLSWDIWPGGYDEGLQGVKYVRSKVGTSYWRYMLCVSHDDKYEPSFRKWSCSDEHRSPQFGNRSEACDGVPRVKSEIFSSNLARQFDTQQEFKRLDETGSGFPIKCAAYFEIIEGTFAFYDRSGGEYKQVLEASSQTPIEFPLQFELVHARTNANRWRYIACHEWTPAMKQWRCR